MDAMKQMVAARTSMILDAAWAFWGLGALRLRLVEDPTCKTAWTDGVSLGFNPAFIAEQTQAKIKGTFVHEVGHCEMGHPWRRRGRDMERWNVACDYALNSVLVAAGLELWDGALYDPKWDGCSAEWIYDRLPKDPPPQPESGDGEQGEDDEDDASDTSGSGADGPSQDQDEGEEEGEGQGGEEEQDGPGGGGGEEEEQDEGEGSGQGDGSGSGSGAQDEEIKPWQEQGGEVRDAPPDAGEITEADWQRAALEAAMAIKSRGTAPGSAEAVVEVVTAPRVEWRSVLRRFATSVAAEDYSWIRPNARYMPRGLYLPALRSERMGPIAIYFDTSGSCWDQVTQEQFAAEVQGVIEDVKPTCTYLGYFDTRVTGVDTFLPGEPLELRPRGGGGTEFAPIFESVEELPERPACVLVLTDMYGGFPDTEPDLPVLWASTSEVKDAPFGEVVPMR